MPEELKIYRASRGVYSARSNMRPAIYLQNDSALPRLRDAYEIADTRNISRDFLLRGAAVELTVKPYPTKMEYKGFQHALIMERVTLKNGEADKLYQRARNI